MTNDQGDSTKGYGSIISAVVTLIGLTAAKWPHLANVVFLSQHTPEVTQLLGFAIAGLGWLGTNISHPPAWLRGPWDDVRFFVASFFRRKPTP